MGAFLRLLTRKPFSKVTVRDIVEECRVNRTTFYYYYQDIYAIVEDLVSSVLSVCGEVLGGGEVSEDALRDAYDFATIHRPALLSLYRGLGDEGVRRYFLAPLTPPLWEYVKACAAGLAVGEEECRAAHKLLCELALGYARLYLEGESLPGVRRLAASARAALGELWKKEKGEKKE